MLESTLLLIGKALGLLLLSIITIAVVWVAVGTLACVICCGLGCGCRGLCRKIVQPWAHHHG